MVILLDYLLFFHVASDLGSKLVCKLVSGCGLFLISVIIPCYLLFIDVLMSVFGKSFRNLFDNL